MYGGAVDGLAHRHVHVGLAAEEPDFADLHVGERERRRAERMVIVLGAALADMLASSARHLPSAAATAETF